LRDKPHRKHFNLDIVIDLLYEFSSKEILQNSCHKKIVLDTVLLGLCAHYTKSGSTAMSENTIFVQLYSHIAESFRNLFVITKTIIKLLYHNHLQAQLSEHRKNFSISYAAIMLSTKKSYEPLLATIIILVGPILDCNSYQQPSPNKNQHTKHLDNQHHKPLSKLFE